MWITSKDTHLPWVLTFLAPHFPLLRSKALKESVINLKTSHIVGFVPSLKHPQVALFHCFLTPTTAPWSASRKSSTHADTPTKDSSHSFLVTSSGPPPVCVMVSCLAFSSQHTSMITNPHAPLQRTHLWTLYLVLATVSYCLPSLIKFLKKRKERKKDSS